MHISDKEDDQKGKDASNVSEENTLSVKKCKRDREFKEVKTERRSSVNYSLEKNTYIQLGVRWSRPKHHKDVILQWSSHSIDFQQSKCRLLQILA